MATIERRYGKFQHGPSEEIKQALKVEARYANKMVCALAIESMVPDRSFLRISFGESMHIGGEHINPEYHTSIFLSLESAYGFAKTIMEAAKEAGLDKKFDSDTLIDDMPDVEHKTTQ